MQYFPFSNSVALILSTAAGILSLGSYVPYVISIVRGRTKPAKSSWMIWGMLDTIAAAGMFMTSSLNGQIVGNAIGAWIVVMLSALYGKSGWSRLDYFCLAGAALGIALWWFFNDPRVGIFISVSIIFLGSIPTFVSAWRDETREDRLTWTMSFLAGVAATLTITAWTVEQALQPVTFLTIETAMLYLLFVRPVMVRRFSVS